MGGLDQREGGLVPLDERGFEFGGAALERGGRSFAPVGSLEPYVSWIGLLLWDVGLASAQRC